MDLPANHARAGLETEAGLKSASRPTVIVGSRSAAPLTNDVSNAK